VAGRASSL